MVTTKTIEEVLTEATDHLNATGSLDTAEWSKRYPEHAEEFENVFPVMRTLYQMGAERRAAAAKTKANPLSLFSLLTSQAGEG